MNPPEKPVNSTYSSWLDQVPPDPVQASTAMGGYQLSLRDRQLRAFFEGAIDAMVIVDDHGRYVDVNPAACDLFGLSREALLGHKVSEVTEFDVNVTQEWRRLLQVGRITGELRLVRSDGAVRHVEYTATANFLPHRHLSVLRDVSDRKQMEQAFQQVNHELEQKVTQLQTEIEHRHHVELALRQSEAQYRTLTEDVLDLSDLGLLILDADFRVVWMNQTLEKFLGLNRQDAIGRDKRELVRDRLALVFESNDLDLSDLNSKVLDLPHSLQIGLPSNRRETFECYVLPDEGREKRWLEYWSQPIQSGLYAGGVIEHYTDITVRKCTSDLLWQKAERERLEGAVTQKIRQSLDLNEVLMTTVEEVRYLLNADRVLIYQLAADYSGTVVMESIAPGCSSMLHHVITDPCIARTYLDHFKQGRFKANRDIYDTCEPCYIAMLSNFQVRATLSVPILQGTELWGLLIVHQCLLPRQWQTWETELLQQLSTQVAIAIDQSQLYQQVQQLNSDLERQVQERTAQLELSLCYESTLKRITDKVRDSLDETQILQTAVQELAHSLDVYGCDAAQYDLEQRTSTIQYEHIRSHLIPVQGETFQMDYLSPVYTQLLRGEYVHYCPVMLNMGRFQTQSYTILSCPMVDDQEVLGDIWLVKSADETFSDLDIRLVQQVSNQCAIALRQSRLYQAAQHQVEELERLNHLKDDFLSTVSHELRSPMSNIKMAVQMLEIVLNRGEVSVDQGATKPTRLPSFPVERDWQSSNQGQPLRHPSPVPTSDRDSLRPGTNNYPTQLARYLQILKTECQRETNLINDLLDLARLDRGSEMLELTPINLDDYLAHIIAPLMARLHSQHQRLEINIPPDLPLLITDPSYLERILAELLHNACKYTPAGECISVAVQVTDSPNSIDRYSDRNGNPRVRMVADPDTLSHVSSATCFQIQVCNTGVEIPSGERDRIFEKFYRIPNNDPWRHGGTGLGLALVKKLAEKLGGTIQVESTTHQTCFILSLPCGAESSSN